MIKYDPKTNVVTMDLVDLEHCGFDHDEFKAALFLAGMDDTIVPEKLVVNFASPILWVDMSWVEEQYCSCRVSVPHIASTGLVCCGVCGKPIRYVNSNTDATGG